MGSRRIDPAAPADRPARPGAALADLYIPVMALWTYAMMIAVATLMRSGPPGDPAKGGVVFKPDTIYNAVRGPDGGRVPGVEALPRQPKLKVCVQSMRVSAGPVLPQRWPAWHLRSTP